MDDLTFITNEQDSTLSKRFNTLIKDTRFFDCLVGYFYVSGFHSLWQPLEKTEKIRILIGISTSKGTFDLIQQAKEQTILKLSHKETKEEISNSVINEMNISKDSQEVEQGIEKFIEWLKSKKMEIRAFPTERIHAKLYIMTFKEGDRDTGRIITGSSNFTQAGLMDNLEFNVELKNRADYEFAKNKFEELWKNSVDVSEKYVETIKEKTWLNDQINPYELYLKFLYEYFREKINLDKDELYQDYFPENFMDLDYQKDAVRDAKLKLEEYGGVFISDVVGLGKTYVSALLAQQLDGRNLVIAPPTLLNKEMPGSWPNVFSDFGIRQTDFESWGQLEKLIKRGTEKYKNVFIDEAHLFRTESTQMYEKLYTVCRGKRVILISATPLNNSPKDILSQIKLFQNAHKSTLPNPKVRDLEKYFNRLHNKLKGLDRSKDKEEYLKIVKENSAEIRKDVLQYLMVRRTRNDIIKYYAKDLLKQKLKFPEIEEPQPVIYHFDEELDKIFNKTLDLIINKFKYSRYTPLLYLKKEISQPEALSQKNMGRFMKVLLLKRLESSFFAFKQTIGRFIYSYKRFLEEYQKGTVYVSKKYINQIFELLENDDSDAIQSLIEKGKASEYHAKDFRQDFEKNLENDFELLKEIEALWKDVKRDPKLDKFAEMLSKDKILQKNKIIVFTESKETATYLESKLNPKFNNKILAFSSESGEAVRNKIIENFDARAKQKKDDYRILISTEILSQGVNLHRANTVINYDIPWNPTRIIQRVGRINRVDTKFDKIYTYNFFPAGPINKNISLKEAAEAKIKAFIEMLGNDARILTDEEIKSHDLFTKLLSKKLISGEDEETDSELKYLTYLREIRDKNKDLFEKIKRLPKKSRTGIKTTEQDNLITFFRKGKLRKIFKTDGKTVEELDFFQAAETLKAEPHTKKETIGTNFYQLLGENKKEFDRVFITEADDLAKPRGSGHEARFIKTVKAIQKAQEFTEDDEEYLREVLGLAKDGAIPKMTIKKILKQIKSEKNPLKILAKIKSTMAPELFQKTISANAAETTGPKEVILSEYFNGGKQ